VENEFSEVLCFDRLDLKKRHIEWDFYAEKAAIYGIYNVSGQVLILPIRGNGKANITLSK